MSPRAAMNRITKVARNMTASWEDGAQRLLRPANVHRVLATCSGKTTPSVAKTEQNKSQQAGDANRGKLNAKDFAVRFPRARSDLGVVHRLPSFERVHLVLRQIAH